MAKTTETIRGGVVFNLNLNPVPERNMCINNQMIKSFRQLNYIKQMFDPAIVSK